MVLRGSFAFVPRVMVLVSAPIGSSRLFETFLVCWSCSLASLGSQGFIGICSSCVGPGRWPPMVARGSVTLVPCVFDLMRHGRPWCLEIPLHWFNACLSSSLTPRPPPPSRTFCCFLEVPWAWLRVRWSSSRVLGGSSGPAVLEIPEVSAVLEIPEVQECLNHEP